ncbi:metallophosphoesterase family protein [Pelomyxa schiedti]|nr:metallophosphoesterase family protein [Pelomyxa schiedti]
MKQLKYVDLWNYEVTYGTKGEDVCCPVVNTGLYDAALESGDIHGMFVGHDHHNDYCGSFAAHPQLMLCYGRKTGFGYSNPEWPMHHGSRIIEITLHSDNSVDFTTWIRDDLGERIDNPAHEPTGPGQLSCTA